jgi:hypothetical protein
MGRCIILTSKSPAGRKSLYEKIQGPGAVPIASLIQHGDKAAQLASADYLKFFRAKLPSVEGLAIAMFAAPVGGDARTAFYVAVHDLRSSSASAGYSTIAAISKSLERLLVECDPENALTRDVIRLHLDALALASSDNAPAPNTEEASQLVKNLGLAVDKIPHR